MLDRLPHRSEGFAHRTLMAVLLLLAACQGGSTERCRIGRATDVPLTFHSGHLFAAPLLNGQPTNMILDTGAQLTAISKESADRLSLQLVQLPGFMEGVGGTRAVYGFEAHSFQIGSLKGSHFQLMASEMALSSTKTVVDGLLGADFLAAYDLDLDLPDHRATLFKTVGGCAAPTTILDGTLYAVPFATPGYQAHVSVNIGGKSLIALIDTGAVSTAIFRNSARRLGLDISQLTTDKRIRATGVGPRAQLAIRHVMAPISIGGLTVQNLPVAIIDQRSLPGADMLIGLDFLSRVHAWFSFSSRSMIFQYPPRPSPSGSL